MSPLPDQEMEPRQLEPEVLDLDGLGDAGMRGGQIERRLEMADGLAIRGQSGRALRRGEQVG